MPNLTIVTDEILDHIESLPYTEQGGWLFLVESDEFTGYWEVQGLDPSFFFDFEDMIGPFRLVSPVTVNDFLELAEEYGYQVLFMEDPTKILDAYEYLKEPPNISLNSTLDGNVQGFLPWQITGYNKLIKDESIDAGFFVWTTGAGKTAAMTSAILHHEDDFDLAFCVVKSHNKIDTQRKLLQLGDIDSVILDGDWTVQRQKNKVKYTAPGPRQLMYGTIQERLDSGESVVVITNYEKFRDDTEQIAKLVEGRRCLFFWDEAPTKLANRDTQLYRACRQILYITKRKQKPKPRPSWMRHWALTATPIENSPEDVYSVASLMKPGVLGTPREFHEAYVSSYSFYGEPLGWKNLEALEAKLQFMTHRVSKDDPQVKAMFPDVIDCPTTVDWNPKHLTLYNRLTSKAQDMIEGLDEANILALIQIMQMMCDAPSMIQASAKNRQEFWNMIENIPDLEAFPPIQGSEIALTLVDQLGADTFTNAGHTKLAMWGEIITQKHRGEKIVTHSTWAEYIFPVWEDYLQNLGVSYVVYHGSPKNKQAALDAFREDPSIRCFLSGDAGSDSIDIAEASVGINYNIPWKWTTLKQREGRRDRVNSIYDQIYTYTLTMPFSVDERKMEICRRKYQYHAQLFDGKASEEAVSSRLTKEELMYLIFGN